MASRFQGKRVLITDCEVMMGPLISEAMRAEGADLVADNRALTTHSAVEDLIHDIAFRFRRWREDQQTWAALRHLDDRQLKEFGIYPRPPDLAKRKFP
jgi:uncharacterized protein YjiS (DUF1127 family)